MKKGIAGPAVNKKTSRHLWANVTEIEGVDIKTSVWECTKMSQLFGGQRYRIFLQTRVKYDSRSYKRDKEFKLAAY